MADIIHLSISLAAILLIGTLLCLPLYKWNMRRFLRSSLFIKVGMWLPIYAVVLACAYGGPAMIAITVTVICIAAALEYRRATKHMSAVAARLYLALFYVTALGVLWYALLPLQVAATLIIIVFVSSALSDVFAFFMGTYIGNHHLPKRINNRKSWEGVVGQIVGGVIGLLFVTVVLGRDFNWLYGVYIGAASAAGDILNSVAKRSLGIKDWGNTIAGHGGVLDRCSSLFSAYFFVAVATVFFK